jgi:hypothetical protein
MTSKRVPAVERCEELLEGTRDHPHHLQTFYVMLCYVMVPLLPPVNCVEDRWGWWLHATSASGRRAPVPHMKYENK